MIELPGRLVLLGHPVAHSLSPRFQNAALLAAGIPLKYEAIDVVPDDLPAMARLLAVSRGAGNVTVPHKEAFAECCAVLSPVARRTGAVNTFWTENGELVGDNTDVGGFDTAVRETVGVPQEAFAVAILGAGGAASAVLAAVERWEGATARIWSRTAARADRLAERYPRIAKVEWSLADALRGTRLVVNATPMGMMHDDIPVDPSLIPAGAGAFDMVYRRGGTPWVHACRGHGVPASDGLPMLVAQGALAFERWFGLRPDRNVMREACE